MREREIRREIKRLQIRLDRLNKERENLRWSPPIGDHCIGTGNMYYDGNVGKIAQDGVMHKTLEAASKHEKQMRLNNWLYQLALELNEGWEPKKQSPKYAIIFDEAMGRMHYKFFSTDKLLGVTYFKDKQTAQRAIEIIKNWRLNDEQ